MTDNDVKLAVSFMYDDMIIQEGAYQLIIANLNNRKSPRDTKVKDTIMSIVEEFFDKNQVALLYICSTGDGNRLCVVVYLDTGLKVQIPSCVIQQ